MDETSRRALRHYQDRADAFWEGTRDHDVMHNIESRDGKTQLFFAYPL